MSLQNGGEAAADEVDERAAREGPVQDGATVGEGDGDLVEDLTHQTTCYKATFTHMRIIIRVKIIRVIKFIRVTGLVPTNKTLNSHTQIITKFTQPQITYVSFNSTHKERPDITLWCGVCMLIEMYLLYIYI